MTTVKGVLAHSPNMLHLEHGLQQMELSVQVQSSLLRTSKRGTFEPY